MRPGELFALEWKHVDKFNQKILIRQSKAQASGIITAPKTEHSVRDVDLSPMASEALNRQWERTGLQYNFIFLNQVGAPWIGSTMRGKFAHHLKLACLQQRQPKQKRHTFATLHLAAGENISWVAKMLGHASAQITWNRYNRFIPNLTRKDGSAFDKIMREKDKNGNNLVTKII